MNNKIFRKIVLLLILTLIFTIVFSIGYYFYHKYTEKRIVLEFKKNMIEIGRNGNYYFSCEDKITVSGVEITEIYKQYGADGKYITENCKKKILRNGEINVEVDSISYSNGPQITYLNNIKKMYETFERKGDYYAKYIPRFYGIQATVKGEDTIWEYVGTQEFNGQKCYVLYNELDKLYPEWIYLDKQTYLPIGMRNKEGYIRICEFKLQPEINENDLVLPDLSDYSKVESDENNNQIITAPDGTVTYINHDESRVIF